MNQTVENEMCSLNQDEYIFTGGHGGCGSHTKGHSFSTTYKKNRSNRINSKNIELESEVNAAFTSFNSSIVPR